MMMMMMIIIIIILIILIILILILMILMTTTGFQMAPPNKATDQPWDLASSALSGDGQPLAAADCYVILILVSKMITIVIRCN